LPSTVTLRTTRYV